MSNILKGAKVSKLRKKDLKLDIKNLKEKGINPKLSVLMCDHDPASSVYAGMIERNCNKMDIEFKLVKLSQEISEEEFLNNLDSLNNDDSIHGIIVMMPLPSHIDSEKVSLKISYKKDIDGISPINAGKNLLGLPTFIPSTSQACQDILKGFEIETSGKNVVIVGRSNIVGKPLANLLLTRGKFADATVTVCHSKTKDLKEVTKRADIIVAAIGSPEFITKEFVSKGQTIVDVGMNEKTVDGEVVLCGDVNFDEVKDIVENITPVPGGVSPLTNVALMTNLLKAIELQKGNITI
ncbi:MAG: bifunctional methylenetetrahydrofolate dehydrogenase/methenyltetrahydrofolate cyclohydrolase [Candidatus Cloacimonadota bacterium]|nr:MAG: bifunctional methylenetetrahydrofolate dehydrogenase/methenyltetrahydrofolate cyclohydrolase [Candidatus Cloacimonadota bacterium]PIE78709.1 MAG: bifunctional methylenetetrahydrofolate dehydrogenase/methenyltetrahydrofolate cyclohydrolase [Candidatus Delongbacteria bacterium]